MDKNSSHCAKGVCADRTAANRFRWMWLVRVLCAGYRAIREDCLGGSVGYCWWLLLMTIWMVISRRFSRVDRSRMTIDLKERRLRLPARGSLPRSDGLIRWSDRTAHWSIANLRRSKVLVVSCGEYSVEKIAPYALRRGVRIGRSLIDRWTQWGHWRTGVQANWHQSELTSKQIPTVPGSTAECLDQSQITWLFASDRLKEKSVSDCLRLTGRTGSSTVRSPGKRAKTLLNRAKKPRWPVAKIVEEEFYRRRIEVEKRGYWRRRIS